MKYYCLVAGLKEYTLDSDTKGFDAPAIIGEIREAVSERDAQKVKLLYTWYDIENMINMRTGREQFSPLGNFSREELAEEMRQPSRLPHRIIKVIEFYNSREKGDEDYSAEDDEINSEWSMERNLFDAYYRECALSDSKFMVRWSEFDRTLRNITAAFIARRSDIPVADVLVGGGDTVQALGRSSAADFGLRDEIDYSDRVMATMAEGENLMDKEYRIDTIRWEKADELSELHYFDMDFILGYLVKVNIVDRWASLDMERGRRLLQKLVDELSGKNILDGERSGGNILDEMKN